MPCGYIYTAQILHNGVKHFKWGYTVNENQTRYLFTRKYLNYQIRMKFQPTYGNTTLIRRQITNQLKKKCPGVRPAYFQIGETVATWYPYRRGMMKRAIRKSFENGF